MKQYLVRVVDQNTTNGNVRGRRDLETALDNNWKIERVDVAHNFMTYILIKER